MGYNTDFYGKIELNKPLDDDTYSFLMKLSNTRRMKRDPRILESLGYGNASDFGIDGELFVDGKDSFGQGKDESIVDYNCPPTTQPGLWCDFAPSIDRCSILWNGNEKTYDAAEWIYYIIHKILSPKGYIANGYLDADGEEPYDQWHIYVKDNDVFTGKGFYKEDSVREKVKGIRIFPDSVKGAKVLVVDDQLIIHEIFKRILSDNGHKVVATAKNGHDALEQYLKVNPDLVIMNITMPEMDGLAALSHILELDKDAYVVMCSSLSHDSIVAESIIRGAKHFIRKPIEDESVIRIVNQVLSEKFSTYI